MKVPKNKADQGLTFRLQISTAIVTVIFLITISVTLTRMSYMSNRNSKIKQKTKKLKAQLTSLLRTA